MRGIEESPDLIAVDAGSTDPGPYYLGSGKSFTDRTGVKKDLRTMLIEGVNRGIPVVVGSCGGSGAAPHLEWCKDIVLEIAKEEGLKFKLGIIPADIDKSIVRDSLKAGRITPLQFVPDLTEEIIDESTYIVAQMGIEPIIEAHKKGCGVILCGRAYDPSVFSAIPIFMGYNPGLAIHCGKILECAAIAATPGSGSDSVMGILREDSFFLKTLSDGRKFTKESTVAHSLYEKSDPRFLPGPGGILNLSETIFTEHPDGVEVSGSRFEPSEKYMVKLEAARRTGYRTITIAGSRDPIMVGNIDKILSEVETRVKSVMDEEGIEGKIFFHIYGKRGTMGDLEPENSTGKEIGILIEVVSKNQESANTICSITRSTLLHYGYEGRISTAGNLAFPFSPSDIKAGEVFEFSIYHLMEIEGLNLFTPEIQEV
ncbi:MAG: acyclic terpene utilization AtuA family protein [Spirochaetales bacterium]|nr:acyclic terpene utilization AtuA family protein [Spirochaetales bacterium]